MVTWHKAISLHCQLILACRHVRYAARLPYTPHASHHLCTPDCLRQSSVQNTRKKKEKAALPFRTRPPQLVGIPHN